MRTTIKKGKTEQDSETFGIKEITLLELRCIYEGLLLHANKSNNPNIRAMASTIYAEVLKDREHLWIPQRNHTLIKKRNAGLLKKLQEGVPVQAFYT